LVVQGDRTLKTAQRDLRVKTQFRLHRKV
jgi:hypothetical protein